MAGRRGCLCLLIIIACLTFPTQALSRKCAGCTLRFCNGISNYGLHSTPDLPFTGALCFASAAQGRVRVVETGEALVNDVPIGTYMPPGLTQHYAPTFFKAYRVHDGVAAIGRQTAHGNQLEKLNGACVKVPVKKIAVVKQFGRLQNVLVEECVAFRVTIWKHEKSITPAVPLPIRKGAKTEPPPGEQVFYRRAVKPWMRFVFDAKIGTAHLAKELYVLVDATGSVGSLLRRTRREIGDMLWKAPFTKIGLGYYRDELDGKDGFTHVLALQKDRNRAAQAFRDIRYTRGGDHAEAALHALHGIAERDDIGWTPGSIRYVLWIGDAPSHEPSCANGRRATRRSVVRAMRKLGASVFAVNLAKGDRGLNSQPSPYGCKNARWVGGAQANFITQRTNGNTRGGAQPHVMVRSALLGGSVRINADDKHCEGKIKVTKLRNFEYLALNAAAGAETRVEADVVVGNKACKMPAGFECTVRFMAGNAVLGERVFKTSHVKGCNR